MIELRQPLIQGNEKEQLAQIKSYLIQFRDELQYAFNNIEGGSSSGGGTMIIQGASGGGTLIDGGGMGGGEESAIDIFNSIKSLIINNAEIISAYSEKIKQNISSEFVASGEYGEYKQTVDSFIEATSENLTITNEKTEMLKTAENFAVIQKAQGYIKTGFLGDEEYGIEIGSGEVISDDENVELPDTQAFARFTSKRVALYNANGIESLTLTTDGMNADRVNASTSLLMGTLASGYFKDEYNSATKTVTTRWVGGGTEETV